MFDQYFAPCKGIRIPESGTFLLEGSGIRENFAYGIRNPGLWNPEQSSSTPLRNEIQNPSSTGKDWNPALGILNQWNGIQNPRLFTIYKNFSGKSGSKVNGTRLFGSSQQKISGSNGTSEKVVLFFRTKYSKRKFVFHFLKVIFDTSLRPSRPFSVKWN